MRIQQPAGAVVTNQRKKSPPFRPNSVREKEGVERELRGAKNQKRRRPKGEGEGRMCSPTPIGQQEVEGDNGS